MHHATLYDRQTKPSTPCPGVYSDDYLALLLTSNNGQCPKSLLLAPSLGLQPRFAATVPLTNGTPNRKNDNSSTHTIPETPRPTFRTLVFLSMRRSRQHGTASVRHGPWPKCLLSHRIQRHEQYNELLPRHTTACVDEWASYEP